VADYERTSGGHVGLFAKNLSTGRTLAWRADERFVMCSTFKASLAGLVLRRVDQGEDQLGAAVAYGPSDIQNWHAPVAEANLKTGSMTVGAMCKASVEESDNTCANLLLRRVGGPAAMTAFWRSLGDASSRLDDPEPFLNRTPLGGVQNTTTPRAMAEVLRSLALGPVLSQDSRGLFTSWLVGCKTGDNRLRSGLPRAWTTGDKTGNNGSDAAGDLVVTWTTGAVPLVIAAYTRGGAPPAAALDGLFQGLGRWVAANLG
jgi:beta-lactamase class A